MKNKHILYTIFILLIVFALAACGGKKEEPKSTDNGAKTTSTKSANTEPTTSAKTNSESNNAAATATPEPPTATPEHPTPTSEPTEEIKDNFAKIEDVVNSYHSETHVSYTISSEPSQEDYTSTFEMAIATDWTKADNAFGSNQSVAIKGLNMADNSDQDTPQEIAMISVDDTMYMKMGDQWITAPRDQADNEESMSISLDDLVENMDELDRVGKEKVNGVDTIHYKYKDINLFKNTLNDILQQELQDKTDASQFKLDDAKSNGDIWIAKKGGYVVKVDINTDATFKKIDSATDANAPDKIRVQMSNVTNVTDVNGNITIEPPADAPQPGQFTAPGFEPGAFPVPEQTTVDGSFGGMTNLTSSLSVDDVNAFYDKELTNMGWTKEDGPMPTWSKDGQSFMLMVTPGENGTTSITILPNGQ